MIVVAAYNAPGQRTVSEVLTKFSEGPQTGIFTDGGSVPNPGPGGWGFVHVEAGEIVEQRHGHENMTTNNRMELTALIEAYRYIETEQEITVHTDSQLCVNTINQWATMWEKRGWRRKGGEIKNLDLIQTLYALSKERPGVTLTWVRGHAGWLWNEYADALAGAWMRDEL